MNRQRILLPWFGRGHLHLHHAHVRFMTRMDDDVHVADVWQGFVGRRSRTNL
jgi:hypothetical protein